MSEYSLTIGVIDDEKNIRRSLRMVLEPAGYEVWEAEDGAQALERVAGEKTDAVLLDLRLPDTDGITLLDELKSRTPGLPVVIISGHGTLQHAVEAVKKGAYDFLEKPLDKDRILVTLKNALEVSGLRRQLSKLSAGGEMVGESPQMEEVRSWIERAGPTEGRVLILGESGTGKELVARAIHEISRRADSPFIKVNCAAIPRELVESVLFGHVKGAFTGALRDKVGTFKQADGGTLFLDEIADMDLEAQAKVLRVLQEGEFEPVGASKTEKVNVRVIAATHRDLQAKIEEGEFREDLYYRLAVLVLDLPPLRDREGDAAVLANHFLRELYESGLPLRILSPAALAAMESHRWPGNIRELRNVIERLVILAPGDEVQVDDLPPELTGSGAGPGIDETGAALPPLGTSLVDVRNDAERRYLEAVLEHTKGNVSEASRIIGLERTHLHKKLASLGIRRK